MVHGSLIQADPLKVPTQTQKTSALAAMDRLPAGCAVEPFDNLLRSA